MIVAPDIEHQEELWARFVDAYSATATRPAVDMFLYALLGAPAKEAR